MKVLCRVTEERLRLMPRLNSLVEKTPGAELKILLVIDSVSDLTDLDQLDGNELLGHADLLNAFKEMADGSSHGNRYI